MATPIEIPAEGDRELVLARLIAASPEAVYRCWTEPELLKQWFAPLPYTTTRAEIDLRPGGASRVTMRAPDGTEHPGDGVYLEIVPNQRLVFTDAYTAGWIPAEKPFFTGIITFEAADGGARYVARARHWTAEDCRSHAAMGFHDGWGAATEQLEAVARTL